MNNWKTSGRGGALLALEQIFGEDGYSNIVLNKLLSTGHYSESDRHLMTELVYGTVTHKMTLEWYLSHFIEDRDKLEPWVYYLLMLSLYQVVYLDSIPTHAIVNEAVSISKTRSKGRGVEKLVNAVLRRITREGLPSIATIKRKNKRLSIQYSVPVWLIRKLSDQYGEERTEAILKSLMTRNKASIRVANMQKYDEIVELTLSRPSQLSPVGLVKDSGNFASTDYFKNGDITIQDESSQLVAPTLKLQGDERVLDACSAPGGKTSHIASYLTTGSILALDLYDHKLELVKENAKRLHVADKIKTLKLDATQVHLNFPKDSFDKILVDAPCSGIGLIRRKPDIKYRKESQDFANLAEIQLDILSSVCQTLTKGGIITYSTCTIMEEENQEVIKKFLETHPNFEQVRLEHPQTDLIVDGCIQITPEQYHSDGFFIAQLKRID